MPVKPAMTWVPSRKGWMKKYLGQMFSVSCRQLNYEATKEASIRAAKEWWEAKEQELNTKGREHPEPIRHEYETALFNHSRYVQWSELERQGLGRQEPSEHETKSRLHLDWLRQQLATTTPKFPLNKWEEDPIRTLLPLASNCSGRATS